MIEEDKADRKRHDNIIKKVFEYPETVNGFFDQHLPDEVKKIIRLDTIKPTKETFIEEHLRSSACDILFETKFENEEDGYIYLIVEGQSSHDPLMAFRLLKYMLEICSRHLKLYGEQDKLPLVYPMIFWQGKDGKYKVKRNIWDLFPYPDIARKAWVDNCKVINVKEIPDKLLIHNIWTGLFQIVTKYIHKPDVLTKKLEEFGDLFGQIDKEQQGANYNINIVCYILTALDKSDKIKLIEVLNKYTNKGEQIMGSVAQEFIDQGIDQGIDIGIDKGIHIGIDKGIHIGIDKGIHIGIDKGIHIGVDKEKKEIALKMIYKNSPLEEISELTGLTVEDIKQLAEKR